MPIRIHAIADQEQENTLMLNQGNASFSNSRVEDNEHQWAQCDAYDKSGGDAKRISAENLNKSCWKIRKVMWNFAIMVAQRSLGSLTLKLVD